MQIRIASTGVFPGLFRLLASPKERCKKTINLVSGDEAVSVDDDDDDDDGEGESRLLRQKNTAARNAGRPWTAT